MLARLLRFLLALLDIQAVYPRTALEGGAYLSGIYIGVPDPRGDLYLKGFPSLSKCISGNCQRMR